VESDLQSFFGCTAVLIGWDPATPPPLSPTFELIYEGAIGQDRRHLFETPWLPLTNLALCSGCYPHWDRLWWRWWLRRTPSPPCPQRGGGAPPSTGSHCSSCPRRIIWSFLWCRSMNLSQKKYAARQYMILCTGASLYAPYSLLLISNKFWMGKGGGWGRSEGAELEGENM
jgi:hypothetical protein